MSANWTHQELLADRTWTGDDIPPAIRTLIGDDLACLVDEEGELDHGLIMRMAYAACYEWPEPETPEWIEAAVEANPGVWIARLCRAMRNLPEVFRSIAYCGQCLEFSNQRKRNRAAATTTASR